VRTASIAGRVLGLALVTCLGCSISDSISKSISSPFESSSDSSGGESAYVADVRDYTVAYVKSSQDVAAFEQGIGAVAMKHGVSNWRASEATYRGIGEGLGKAQVTPTQLEVYKANLTGGNAVMATAMQQGYARTHED
jgi:hypothetical protein